MKGTMAQWLPILPLEFYLEIFKLHQWEFTIKRIEEKAGLLARWTQVYIFKRLKKEVLDELKKSTPDSQQGKTVLPHLQQQLTLVMEHMSIASDWNTFVKSFRKEFGEVPFYFSPENLEGIGGISKQQFDEALLRIVKGGPK